MIKTQPFFSFTDNIIPALAISSVSKKISDNLFSKKIILF